MCDCLGISFAQASTSVGARRLCCTGGRLGRLFSRHAEGCFRELGGADQIRTAYRAWTLIEDTAAGARLSVSGLTMAEISALPLNTALSAGRGTSRDGTAQVATPQVTGSRRLPTGAVFASPECVKGWVAPHKAHAQLRVLADRRLVAAGALDDPQ